MKVLVANLGSTSFKYRLFDMTDERQLARGGVERIGSAESPCMVEIGGVEQSLTAEVPHHGVAVARCLEQLTDPETGCLKSADEVAAIGFKAVHGGRFSGVQRVNDELLDEMQRMAPVAPAHNPPYVSAMRQLSAALPNTPLVAAFETGFHQTIPNRNRYYTCPYDWAEDYGVLRYGFHGASHRYIATRTAEFIGRKEFRLVSCHLGGSSSVCAIKNGESVATSMGMSPQGGLPHNNRSGDFDPFALAYVQEQSGRPLDELLTILASGSGLLGLSGLSGDVRDLEQAAAAGHERAQLALDVFIASTRHYLGAYMVELGGLDVLAFTGGIGEKGRAIRTAVCEGLEELGIELDPDVNAQTTKEGIISKPSSRTQVWVVPTNEELIVARQTRALLEA